MKYVPKAVTRTVGRTVLRAQAKSPQLLFVAGISGAIGATVLACRATLRAQPVVDDWKKNLVEFESQVSRQGSFNESEYKKDLGYLHLRHVGDVAKLYAPAFVVGVISIGCLTKSHRQLAQRNAALTAAYVSLQSFLEGYRGRVREAIGEEKERDVYYASTPVELVEDTKNGPKKIYGSTPTTPSPYAVYFTDKSLNHQNAPEYNRHFVQIQARHATDELRAKGHLFLNEVYDRLGIVDDHGHTVNTQTGQVCGWFVGHPDSDDFVEISIYPIHDFQDTLLLDFNVGGNVLHMLDESPWMT